MSKIIREYCGDCLKCFTSLDYANPVMALVEHKRVCPKRKTFLHEKE